MNPSPFTKFPARPVPAQPQPADMPGYPGDLTDPTALPNEPAPTGVVDLTAQGPAVAQAEAARRKAAFAAMIARLRPHR